MEDSTAAIDKKSGTPLILVAADIIVALSFIYLAISFSRSVAEISAARADFSAYEQRFGALEDVYAKNAAAIASIRRQADEAFTINPMQFQDQVQAQSAEQPPVAKPFATLTLPQKPSFCLGEQIPIQWETSANVDLISLRISGDRFDDIGAFPASYNESGADNHKGIFIWRVGDVTGYDSRLDPGTGYRMHIYAHLPPNLQVPGSDSIEGQKSLPFSIVNCP